jgi:biopolymer transport protein ExbB
MIDMFYKGGPLMYPLLLGSVLMVAVITERSVRFLSARTGRRSVDEVRNLAQQGRFKEARDRAAQAGGAIGEYFAEALTERSRPAATGIPAGGRDAAGRDAAGFENRLSLAGDRVLTRLNRNLHLLELIGRIAPMIGLLGTVMGMVEAFQQVASVRNLVDPSMLASGIWEALITTVTGLFVGIPALVAHHLFANRIKAIAFAMKHYGEEVLSTLRDAEAEATVPDTEARPALRGWEAGS